MEEVINFQGNCIYKTSTSYFLSKKEKNYLSTLKYYSKDNLGFISEDVNILDNPLCNNLKNIFNNYTNYYVRNLLEINQNLKLLNSWVTMHKKGSFHPTHNHPNTFISVCFYPQIKNGSISFISKSPLHTNTNLLFNNINSNFFNSNQINLSVSPNDIVIFPGWLDHKGGNNTNDLDRIMIGANYFISGHLGTPENVNELQLL
jgi:hypothetical protein